MNVANFTQSPETELMVSLLRPFLVQSVDQYPSSSGKDGKFRVCVKRLMWAAGGST